MITLHFFRITSKRNELDAVCVSACKFEGLLLCHQFFYGLSNLLEDISVNKAKEGIKKIAKKIWNAITPEYQEKVLKLLP